MDDGLRDRLIRLVRRLLDPAATVPDPFPVEQRLSDLGINSLKMVSLMLAVETEFNLAIPPGDITPETFHSVGSIAMLVERLMPPRVNERH